MIRKLLATALAATLMATTALHAQSLADVAKKTGEERAAKAKDDTKKTDDTKKQSAAKVYTDKDLADVPPSLATAPVETKTKTEPASVPTTPAVDNAVKTEAYWKARMSTLRVNLSQATNAHLSKAALVARLEAVRDNVPERGFSVAQAYAAASSELAKARADLEVSVGDENAAKAAISAAEEEARRLGVLPGWLR